MATYDRDGIEMQRFEQAICLHAANGKYPGAFISVDTGADVNLE